MMDDIPCKCMFTEPYYDTQTGKIYCYLTTLNVQTESH